ncbi:unnamed protein product [Staurois parvus]|uniref:Uncharacterized protein n=1 Tax=Staurois parvus TaxID=386267 RepID=A0ABN9AJ07_9NEOB|nr:unnamed protein product [Staurois parvus]
MTDANLIPCQEMKMRVMKTMKQMDPLGKEQQKMTMRMMTLMQRSRKQMTTTREGIFPVSK